MGWKWKGERIEKVSRSIEKEIESRWRRIVKVLEGSTSFLILSSPTFFPSHLPCMTSAFRSSQAPPIVCSKYTSVCEKEVKFHSIFLKQITRRTCQRIVLLSVETNSSHKVSNYSHKVSNYSRKLQYGDRSSSVFWRFGSKTVSVNKWPFWSFAVSDLLHFFWPFSGNLESKIISGMCIRPWPWLSFPQLQVHTCICTQPSGLEAYCRAWEF